MIWPVWKLQRRIACFFLLSSLLTLALLIETPPARPQGASLDDPPSPLFGSHSGEILGTVYRGETSFTVSVRELKIPPKAQNEYNRGLELVAKNDFAGSLAHFSKAAAVYPDYYEAIYYLGLVQLRLQHEDQAIQAFQKAIDLSGGHYARAQFAYGLIFCDERKPEEAERLIRRGLETDPDSEEGHLFLGIALLDQNRLDEAEKSLREALLRRPDYPGVYLVLADVHARKKDYRSQVRDLDAYLKLAPSSAASADVRRVRGNAQRLSTQSAPVGSQN